MLPLDSSAGKDNPSYSCSRIGSFLDFISFMGSLEKVPENSCIEGILEL